MGLLDKIRGAKDKLERATYEEKAKTRARERRVDMGEPEGVGETAEVVAEETKELGGQAKEFVGAAVPGGAQKAGGFAAGIGKGIGEGGESVIDDIESGGGIDVIETSSGSNGGGLDPIDTSGGQKGSLGMDDNLGADMSGFDDDLDMFD